MSEESIFIAALELRTPVEQARYLDEACRGNSQLRQSVESLLAAHREDAIRTAPMPAETVVESTDGRVIGPYKLRERIGEGGMGTVYIAEQERPVRRKVALKLVKLGMDTHQVVARFEAERQALALMDHPYIAKVLDAGATDTGRPFFVMELVRGMPITDFCRQAQLTTDDRLRLFVDVCQAVQHAHQKGIIHRDLKPSNVLVGEVDGRPVPKVIDFGIAKATGQQLTDQSLYTVHGQLVGTPLYMSPEQTALSGMDVDTRSDVYSLGVMLYELLTGTTPVSREALSHVSYDELRRIIREDDPPRPSTRVSTLNAAGETTTDKSGRTNAVQLIRQLRGELDWIVMRALEKDRNRRYESPSALAADIERYLGDEPVLACPPSWRYRLGKYVRRHKGLLTTAALVTAALLTGLAAALWQADEADRARQLAEDRQRDEATARKEAEAEKKRALTNFDIARQAVARMLTRVARDDLSMFPAMKEIRENLLADAATLYTDLLALQPDDVETLRQRGQVYNLQRSYDAAMADFRRVIELDPDDYVSLAALSELYHIRPESQHRDLPAALQMAERAIAAQPDNPKGHLRRIKILIDTGNKAEAQKAMSEYERVVPESAEKYREIGLVHSQMGDREAGIVAARKALEINPNDAHAYKAIGINLAILRRDDEALAALDRALALNPKIEHERSFLYVLEERAQVYLRKQQYDAAIADTTRCIELFPTRSFAYKRRAVAHFHLGRPAAALADLRRALELHPKDASSLTWVPAEQAATHPDPAYRAEYVKLADETVERSGQSTEAVDGRAAIRQAFLGPSAALADLLLLVEREPQRYEPRWQTAVLALLNAGQTAEYRQACSDILKRFQNTADPTTAALIVWTAAIGPKGLDDYAPVLDIAKQSVEAAADDPQRLMLFGALQMRAGQFTEARTTLLRARDLPENAAVSGAALEYWLALTERKLGHEAEALTHRERAKERAEQERAADQTGLRTAMLHRLQAEAEAADVTPP